MPYQYTQDDLAGALERQESIAAELRAFERNVELRGNLGLDRPTFVATLVVAAQVLAQREEERKAGADAEEAPIRVGPADRLRLTALSDRELRALLDYAAGLAEAEIARRLNEQILDRHAAVQPHQVAGFIERIGEKLTREFRNNALLGGQEPAGRGVRTEAAERDAIIAETVALPLLAEALGLDVEDVRDLVRNEVVAAAAGMSVQELLQRVRNQVVLFGQDRWDLMELWESVPRSSWPRRSG